jgi:hypothetical protein
MKDELSKEQELEVISKIEDLEQSVSEWVNSDNEVEGRIVEYEASNGEIKTSENMSFKTSILTAIQNKLYKKD